MGSTVVGNTAPTTTVLDWSYDSDSSAVELGVLEDSFEVKIKGRIDSTILRESAQLSLEMVKNYVRELVGGCDSDGLSYTCGDLYRVKENISAFIRTKCVGFLRVDNISVIYRNGDCFMSIKS